MVRIWEKLRIVINPFGVKDENKRKEIRNWDLWGLVIAVDDIDATSELLGDLLGQVKPAVQPHRRIATLKKEAELGVAIAFLGPKECHE